MTTTYTTTYGAFLALGMATIQKHLWYNIAERTTDKRVHFYWVTEDSVREIRFLLNGARFALSKPSDAFAKDGENKKAQLPGGQFSVKISHGMLTNPAPVGTIFYGAGPLPAGAPAPNDADIAIKEYYLASVIMCQLLAHDAVDYNDYYDDAPAGFFAPPGRFSVERSIDLARKMPALSRNMSSSANHSRFGGITRSQVCNNPIKCSEFDIMVKSIVAKCNYREILKTYKGNGQTAGKVYFCQYLPSLDYRTVEKPNQLVARAHVAESAYDMEIAKSTSTLKPASVAEIIVTNVKTPGGIVRAYVLPLFRFYGLGNIARGNICIQSEIYLGGKQSYRSVVTSVVHLSFDSGAGAGEEVDEAAYAGFGGGIGHVEAAEFE